MGKELNDIEFGKTDSLLIAKDHSITSDFRGGTTFDGTFSLFAATIGTGIVMIPNVLAASGAVWSFIQMIVCALMSYYTLMILVRCAHELDADSYQEIAYKTFGQFFRQIVNFTCFCSNWGSSILYIQLSCELFAISANSLAGDRLPVWLADPDSKILIVLVTTVFMLPLCLARQLKALRYFCFINMIFIFIFCFAVLYEGLSYQSMTQSFKSISLFNLVGFYTTFPSAAFSYMSHTNIIDIFRELNAPTIAKMKKMISVVLWFVLIAFMVVGIIGFAPFSANLDILSDVNYSNGVILVAYGYTLQGVQRAYPALVLISMVTMILSIVISQPYNIKPAKDSVRDVLHPIFKSFGLVSSEQRCESNAAHVFYVIITLYTSVVVVLYSQSIQMVYNIVGASISSLLCFVFPPMFYLKLHKDTITTPWKIFNWAMIICNTIFAIWNTYENI